MPRDALRTISVALIAVAITIAGSRVHASDGRIEINQTCAERTGCGPGDDPGFPVILAGAGSYVLTSDIVVSDPDQFGLIVAASHTWIDLRGFAIKGPVSCVNPGAICLPPGNGSGIISFAVPYTTVVNGTVRGFGIHGINLRESARVENVLAIDNAHDGVACTDGCLIRHVRAIRNGTIGISTEAHGVLVDNLVDGNGSNGILTNVGAVVVGNTVDANGTGGITTLAGGDVVNDNQVRRNKEHGIRASIGSIVEGNTVTENGTLGLFLNNAAGYGFNVIRPDTDVAGSGTVSAGAQNLGGNLCNGSTTCP